MAYSNEITGAAPISQAEPTPPVVATPHPLGAARRMARHPAARIVRPSGFCRLYGTRAGFGPASGPGNGDAGVWGATT